MTSSDRSFLDEPFETIASLSARYKVSETTLRKWIDKGHFNKPNEITVYRLHENDRVRVTLTGVEWFESHIQVIDNGVA